jgi:hypothetical protein
VRASLVRPTLVRAGVVSAGVFLPLATVWLLDPNVEGHYPTCPIRSVVGVDCPGCGSLRAMHDLAHGDFLGALDHNAMLVLFLPLLGLELARWVASRPATALMRWRYAPMAAMVVLSAWMLARNLPMFPLDALGSGAGDWA